jgi:hypothetical protein
VQGAHQLAACIPDLATTGEACAAHLTWGRRSDLQWAHIHLDLPTAGRDFIAPVGGNIDLVNNPVFKVQTVGDLIDVEAGPALGVTQAFKFELTLATTILFSRPVRIAQPAGPARSPGRRLERHALVCDD